MSKSIQCDVCGNDLWRTSGKELIICLFCGLVRAKVNPTTEELIKCYQEDYFFGDEYVDYIKDKEALSKNFRLRIRDLEKQNAIHRGKRIVEIGCAYGFFLSELKEKGYEAVGYDIAEDGVVYGCKKLGVDARVGNIQDMKELSANTICMWDVIEHVPNPKIVMKNVSEILPIGGHVALTTGDIGALVPKIQKNKWRMIHPPTHLFYFSRSSITKLLEKHGFYIISFSHPGVTRSVDSILRMIILFREKEGLSTGFFMVLYKFCSVIRLTRLNVKLNLFDIMQVIAVKKR